MFYIVRYLKINLSQKSFEGRMILNTRALTAIQKSRAFKIHNKRLDYLTIEVEERVEKGRIVSSIVLGAEQPSDPILSISNIHHILSLIQIYLALFVVNSAIVASVCVTNTTSYYRSRLQRWRIMTERLRKKYFTPEIKI